MTYRHFSTIFRRWLHGPGAALLAGLSLALAAGQASASPRLDHYGDPLPEGALARMGTARLRHPQAIGLVFAADGNAMISAGQDGTVRFWDLETGMSKRVQRLPGHAQGAKTPRSQPLRDLGTSELARVLAGQQTARFPDIQPHYPVGRGRRQAAAGARQPFFCSRFRGPVAGW